VAALVLAITPLARADDTPAPPAPDAPPPSEPNAPAPDESGTWFRNLEVESPRAPSRLLEAPQSISVISSEEMQRAQPNTAIDEALGLVPGVVSQGGRNFSQDARVAIRGFGATSQFGVRGIRVLVDGIPSTSADGQSELDSLELDFVDRMEVLRGPVSSLYGGGGGGVVLIDTFAPTKDPVVRARASIGSYDLQRYSALTTGTEGNTGYVLGVSGLVDGGYREHSTAKQWNVLGKVEHEFESGTVLGLNFSNVTAPVNDEPGALTAAEVRMDRRDAQPQALTRDAGEDLDQQKLGLTLRQPLGEGRELRAVLWGLQRGFANLLTINRAVDLDRKLWGTTLLFDDHEGPLRIAAGADLTVQRDLRRNFENLGGRRGALSLVQSENVTTVGPFVQTDLSLPLGFGLTGGVRWDWTDFDFGDRFVTATSGDSSSEIKFRQLSPRFGARWRHSDAFMVYANVGSGFQVPTTTELAAADGSLQRGFDAERTFGTELGAKGVLFGGRVYYGAALFDLRVKGVAVPFENAGGQTLYRDAGSSRRRGLELETSAWLGAGFSLRGSYSYSSFRYSDFESLQGSALVQQRGHIEPGEPVNSAGLELRYDRGSGFFATAAVHYFSKMWVDDANTQTAPGATAGDLRAGWKFKHGDLQIEPYVGAKNFTGVKYDDRIRPNAVNPPGRFFEPAPRATVYAGVEIQFGR
jgi:iron complex outermembrane receptor protein